MFSFCQPSQITNEELSSKLSELSVSCAGPFLESRLEKSRKHRELRLLVEMSRRASDSQLESLDLRVLLSCAIKLSLKYSNSPLHLEPGLSERRRQRKCQQVRECFDRLLWIFVESRPAETIKAVVDFVESENLWPIRRFAANVIGQLLEHELSGAAICHEICDKIEFPQRPDTKSIVRVLYELLDVYRWPDSEDTAHFLERLLGLYYKTLHDNSASEEDRLFGRLRGSLELCIRHIVRNVSRAHLVLCIERMAGWSAHADVQDNVIENYGSALEYVASMHRGLSIASTLSSDMVTLLMEMIASGQQFVSLLGNRVFQYMIDRGENRALFNTPKIFFEGMRFNLKIHEYDREDSKFLKLHRELVHESLTSSVINHHYDRINLETTYCTLCLLAVEVPCGFSAATICCLMMHIQEIVMKHPEMMSKEASYHVHATIISVLSFICWVHKASEFHSYVYGIVMERAQWAPHLNPPLRSSYNFAVHHVLWDKPELFLIDWEVRYGLWRRFRLNQVEKSKEESKKDNEESAGEKHVHIEN